VAIDRFKRKSIKLGSPDPNMTLTCIAWDTKQSRPRIFVCGDALEAFGANSDEPCEAPGFFFGIASDQPSKHWAGGSPCDPERFQPAQGAQAVFETARAVPFTHLGGSKPGYFIGGQLHWRRP
jgi:hypothetical protein